MVSPPPPADDPVVAVELWQVAVPLRSTFRAAHGAERDRVVVVIAARLADGTVGWGECDTLAAPTYTPEWTADAFRALRDDLVPDLLAGGAGRAADRPMASAGLATAVLDARLRVVGRSLRSWLGAGEGPLDRTVVLGRSGDADATVAAVADAFAGGARLVKLKLGDAADLAALAAVRATFPDAPLAADANGSLDPVDLATLRAVDALGLTYLEQPCAAHDPTAIARVVDLLGTPVALDESIGSVADVHGALRARALRTDRRGVVNVKPARLGGVDAAVDVLAMVRDAGLGAFVGGMLELGVGRAAAAAVAASPGFDLPTDLGPSAQYVEVDVAGPVIVDGAGRLVVPDGPGIGVEADRDRLRATAVDSAVLQR